MSLIINEVDHFFGNRLVLSDINLVAEVGQILCLIGPSGSGKTTLLRLIAGFESLRKGSISLDSKLLASEDISLPPEERSIGFVFQENVLFPHLTVSENIGFGLSSMSRNDRSKIVDLLLSDMGMSSFGKEYPETLSGGERQRISLAQSLARKPKIMLLDEPFNSVDPNLRRDLRSQTRKMLKNYDAIAIIVTHDPQEAFEMGDYIGVVDQGKLHQVDTPQEIWSNPSNESVLLAFGDLDVVKGYIEGNKIITSFGIIPFEGLKSKQFFSVYLRPDAIQIEDSKSPLNKEVRVSSVCFKGSNYTVQLIDNDDNVIDTLQKPEIAIGIKEGMSLYVQLDPKKCFFFE